MLQVNSIGQRNLLAPQKNNKPAFGVSEKPLIAWLAKELSSAGETLATKNSELFDAGIRKGEAVAKKEVTHSTDATISYLNVSIAEVRARIKALIDVIAKTAEEDKPTK